MELHILEHSLKVASIEKEGIEICTHGLIKLAFLASKTRCSPQTSSLHTVSGPVRVLEGHPGALWIDAGGAVDVPAFLLLPG
ncbi:hypothetical protein ILYODFUR_014617 [Ilyodon furcidens]|uniref:CASTOR1 N-terminal domain-containing protein n=1 Tax=Ilyodon furcidens TaxID=33524 RepID=A0ABV0SMG2_9TELE